MSDGIAVLLFGAFVITAEIFVMVKLEKGWGQSNKQIVGITLIIITGLFLATGDYTKEYVAPMFGLLGAIAGYLFGAGVDKSNGK